MIHTAKQLKDKVKNMSGGNGEVAQALIRTYFMERFLERVSVSEYRNSFILKGGMLVASIVGVDMRATMDIDTTVKALPLNEKDARAIIERIGELQLEDGVTFKITSVKEIMEEFDYPGVRMVIEANLERMRQPFKIDISTDDAITPGAVEYKYKLMFEDRSISVLSYNLETLLAEKMQTILARGLANTRMRDFYDVYEIMNSKADQISFDVLKKAFAATCMKRETSFGEEEVRETLDKIKDDSGLEEMWNRFKRVNYFVDDLPWGEISETIVDNIEKISFFSDQVSWISDEKGIKIKDREYAEEMLRQIGYFPLMGGYKHLFRISNTKKYKAGTSFEEIVSLYKFDAELRELFFKYLLQIERQMRSLMSYYFTEMYGAEQKQYLDANNYNNTKRNHATIVKLIATLKRATTTTDYTYINYYRKTYGEIPLWVLANVLTFGNLSKMFRVFPQSLKSKVSKNFEPLNQHQMEQFLSVLTKYRNVCAHGERLFTYRTVDAIADTPLHKKLSLPQSGNQYEKGKQDLFAVVIAFRYILPGKDFLEFKRKLIKEIDRVNREVEHISEVELLNKMGFSENWKSITKYHLK